jgi:hypothetical protein
MLAGNGRAQTHHFGGLLNGQAAEVTQLDELSFRGRRTRKRR